MSRKTRWTWLTLWALVAAMAVGAPAADAVTWHNSGDTAFTATGGASTFSFTGVPMACTGTTSTATTTAAPFVGGTWAAFHGTLITSGCFLGGIGYRMHCRYTFTASGQTGATTTGATDLNCTLYGGVNTATPGPWCQYVGTIASSSYVNPANPVTPGRFTLPSFTLPSSNCTSSFGSSGSWTHQAFTVTAGTGGPSPHQGPVITRTP